MKIILFIDFQNNFNGLSILSFLPAAQSCRDFWVVSAGELSDWEWSRGAWGLGEERKKEKFLAVRYLYLERISVLGADLYQGLNLHCLLYLYLYIYLCTYESLCVDLSFGLHTSQLLWRLVSGNATWSLEIMRKRNKPCICLDWCEGRAIEIMELFVSSVLPVY